MVSTATCTVYRISAKTRKQAWSSVAAHRPYLAKVAFAQCILVCYRQRIWRTFRNHDLSIRSIDQLFSGTEDVSLLMNWETVQNAPLATALVLIVWILPLATVIASPSALSFSWRLESSDAFVSVPTLNFSIESYKDWRTPVLMDNGQNKRSMIFYNTTNKFGSSPESFDYYDQPSTELRRLFWRNIFLSSEDLLNATFNQESARHDSCGGPYNCTYAIQFMGPGYKCEDVTQHLGGPFNTSVLVPEGDHVYHSDVSAGDYEDQPVEFQKGPGGVPVGKPPQHLGDFRFEPELWLGYSINTTIWLRKNESFANNWTHGYGRKIARCIHYETQYTVNFNFTGQTCLINRKTEYLQPILGHNFSHSYSSGIIPSAQWVSPRSDPARYKKTAVYHAVGSLLRDVLKGYIVAHPPIPGPQYTEVYSDLTKSPMVQKNSEPLSNLTAALEQFYSGVILSLLTVPAMLVTSRQNISMNRSRQVLAFNYKPSRLWLCYGPVIFLTVGVLILWAWTVWEDGVTFSSGFSRIVVATRNSTLDEMSKGLSLGNDPFPPEFMKSKLRFGKLGAGKDGTSSAHYAFGTFEEITCIRKRNSDSESAL